MKYYCATEVDYLKTIKRNTSRENISSGSNNVRKPKVYTRTRRNNVPIATIRKNILLATVNEFFSKEQALELALEVKNRKACWNCETCVMIEIREEQE